MRYRANGRHWVIRQPRAEAPKGVVPVASVTAQRLLTVREAAEFLRISRNGLYILAREGKVPSYRIGNSVRFDLDELRAWLEEQRRGPKVGD